jgi:hypothetical protein
MFKRNILLITLVAFIFNILDLIFTVIWVYLDVATEANFILKPLLEVSKFKFCIFKIILFTTCLAFLYYHRDKPLANFGLFFSFAIYSLIVIYHITIGIRVTLNFL